VKLRRYAVKPMCYGGSGALGFVSSSISPWAGAGAVATTAQVRHGNDAERPKGLTERLIV